MTTALSLQNVQKSYGALPVLHDINITLDKGEFLVLVGPSGCGKSTLLNCVAGLEETSSGCIQIDNIDVTALPPRERNIAMVFQSYALYPTMSVADNIAFGMKVRGLPKNQRDDKISKVAELLQIQPLLNRRPSQLSGGQRQRVAMGRALVREPALFLFDEPLSNLDAKLRIEMRAEIKRMHEATKTSIVYVTHDQVEAMTLASKIVVMKDGYIQQVGTPAEIYHQPANTFVANFMGSPAMNLVPATCTLSGFEFSSGQQLSLSEQQKHTANGKKVIVGIRPEAITLGDDICVQPSRLENTGADVYISFPLGGADVTARLPGNFPIQMNTELSLAIAEEAISLFDFESGERLS